MPMLWGVSIHYQTLAFHHIRFGLSGYFIYNVFSADLGRPGEFYLNYQRETTRITLSRQLIQTPFINPQDSPVWRPPQ